MKIVNFSGGKDSTAMLLKMIELKMPIDKIVFADTGLEFPEMYYYIKKIEKHIKRKITILKPKTNWNNWFYGKVTKGKRKGQIRGFPYVINYCWANREFKAKSLDSFNKKASKIYVGIAKDEKHRIKRKMYNNKDKWIFPLIKWGWSEINCYEYLQSKNLLNPLYKKFNRLGCWLCPKQSIKSLQILYNDYPKLWEKLKQYEKDSLHGFKPNIKLIDLENKFKNNPKINNYLINQKTLKKIV